MRQHLVELTQQLIRFRSTVHQPEQIRGCVDFVKDFFQQTSLRVEHIENKGVHSLFISKGTKHPKVLLSGHLDVVSGDDDQFVPVLREGKLFGRGALDMKSGISVMMMLMRECSQNNFDVGLMLTTDEELGGFDGTGYIVEQGYLGDVVIIPDGGEAVHHVVTKAKGVIHVTVTATGSSAHASHMWDGKNAIYLLMRGLESLRTLFLRVREHPKGHWVNTFNIGRIQGGLATNVVPNIATAQCDIRFIETQNPHQLITLMRSVLPPGVELDVYANEPPMITPMNHPLVLAYMEAIKTVGRVPMIDADHGSSDGRFFSAKGVPVILAQPDGGNIHAKGEWVDIQSIDDYYTVLHNYLHAVCG